MTSEGQQISREPISKQPIDAILKEEQFGLDAEPKIVLVKPQMIQELSQTTSAMMDQYQADVAQGADKMVSAKFYMEHIFQIQKYFWHEKLAHLEQGHLEEVA